VEVWLESYDLPKALNYALGGKGTVRGSDIPAGSFHSAVSFDLAAVRVTLCDSNDYVSICSSLILHPPFFNMPPCTLPAQLKDNRTLSILSNAEKDSYGVVAMTW
jgi:hypothetical protein